MKNKKLGSVVAGFVIAGLALALFVPGAARAQNAYVTSNYRPGGQALPHGSGPVNLAQSILKLPVPDGVYVINAKTSIVNAAAAAQSGNCKLWALIGGFAADGSVPPTSNLVVIDQTEFKIGAAAAGNQQAVALQAASKIVGTQLGSIKNNNVIGVECRAFSGTAVDSVLTAVLIDGNVVTLAPALYEAPPPPQQF